MCEKLMRSSLCQPQCTLTYSWPNKGRVCRHSWGLGACLSRRPCSWHKLLPGLQMKVTKLHIPRHLIVMALREWSAPALRQMHLVQAVRHGGHFLTPGLVLWFVEISNSQTAGRHLSNIGLALSVPIPPMEVIGLGSTASPVAALAGSRMPNPATLG